MKTFSFLFILLFFFNGCTQTTKNVNTNNIKLKKAISKLILEQKKKLPISDDLIKYSKGKN